MLILGLFFTSISFAGNHLGGWMMYYGNLSLNQSDFKLHYEYQHRNHELLSDLNQALFRTALQYNLKNQLQFSAGYGFIQTEKMDVPDMPFREHRLYQEASTQQNILSAVLKHRFRYEQRFMEHQDMKTRFRYSVGTDIPILKKGEVGTQLYATFYNEIFINGGNYSLHKNGLFDRNRLYFAAGFKPAKNVAIQAGWMNQMLEKVSHQQLMISIHHNLSL